MYLNPRMVGCGERTLVLSHGYGASQAIWDRVLPHLALTNKVLLFDWDFSGGGGADEEEQYTFERFADELVAVMEEMGARDAVYVGHSMAGMIGCIASIKRPDLFAHLVLVGASPRYINSEDYEGGFDEPDIDAMLATISTDFLSWAKGFVPLIAGDGGGDAEALVGRSFFAMDPRAASALARMIFLGDNRAVLARVAAPCTLVHATGDVAAPPCVGAYMRGRIGRAALVTVDSVGHFPQLVAPDEMVRILDAVLANGGGGVVVEESSGLAAVAEVEVKGDIDVAT
uniref:AB hydrolase-1 domain-containing protein n=1 Tax=Leersia perrieri TaxID=77586 RepID=A0A0D9V2J7_9ORYZ